jgi:hypothetical protein
MYNFKAKAKLYRVVMEGPPRHSKMLADDQLVFSGTLEECINKVMEKRDAYDRQGHRIVVGPDANVGNTELNLEEIEALYKHVEFPGR